MKKQENTFETVITVIVILFLLKFVVGGMTRAWVEQQLRQSGITAPLR